ncbi:hypothetical protein PV327_008523 [Microctonus hyperodae]|uniref:Chitin-binding type-2 domain-containing protein n=2 Tax=Microctonus hyperodae TaxID=165561 RepID=A0AA39F3C6_MICHY|nr:hypothetical protein PV327_008523 [Microctonus hyperodae]
MKIFTKWLLLLLFGCTWRETISTCVLESDFGFTLNCAFKKSGLFRVRNLGGVGGYIGLGISVGDELGFRNSLSNLESTKRRSVQAGRGNFIAIGNGGNGNVKKNDIPPFKPLPPGASRPIASQPEHQRLVVQHNSTVLRTIPAPSLMFTNEAAIQQQQQQKLFMQQQQQINSDTKLRQQQRIQQETLAIQMLKEQRQQQREANIRQKLAQQQESFKQQSLDLQTKRVQSTVMGDKDAVYKNGLPNIIAAVPSAESLMNVETISQSKPVAGILVSDNGLPAFIAMPQSSAQLTDRIGNNSPILSVESADEVYKDNFVQHPLPSDQMAQSVNEMTLQSLNPIDTIDSAMPNNDKAPSLLSSSLLRPIKGMSTSLKALAEASNITLEALEAVILLRQQQLMEKQREPMSTTTTTTTTQSSVKSYTNSGVTKVMNAPREYYPMNYDKNFDDNFASRVDLPDTSFYCGDQKHFPGLYADEDLGCMVFHVCALTDDGLIMKSFLCPESTLFDQTILKCNWWFYVDCKTSKNLYDSNIPISKSYQLMKALAFFSAYKNHDNASAVDNVNHDS